jgi:hypothetical protein
MMKHNAAWADRIAGLVAALACFTALITAVPPSAKALPPPLDDKELRRQSDLVATVHVLAVSCIDVRRVSSDAGGQEQSAALGTYQAWAQLVEVEKGDEKPQQTLLITWRERSPFKLGGSAVAYFPGEVVNTHLIWNAEERSYRSTHWNAKDEPKIKRTGGLPAKKAGTVRFTDRPPGMAMGRTGWQCPGCEYE